MKMNLFSVFNPITTKSTSLMWITMLLMITMIPVKIWAMETKTKKTMTMMTITMHKQFKNMMKPSTSINIMMLMSTMMMIMMANMLGMFPFSYPQTSQPQMTLSMAMPMWLGIMMMKLKSPEKVMAHMVPPSTPMPLMPLMVMIETISNSIQPITLSVRLMANITAGHILMSLISESNNNPWTFPLTMTTQITFTLMEVFVSIIQAYVFSMLLSMYMK